MDLLSAISGKRRTDVPVTGRRPRRILHVVNRLGDRGDGISNMCVDLACQQAIDGEAVGVATSLGGYTDLVARLGVTVTEVDFRVRRATGVARAVVRLRRLVRTLEPEIVHAHTLLATVLARVATVGTSARVVATVHNDYQRGVVLMAAAHRVVGVSAAVSDAMRGRGVPRRKIRTVLNGTVGSVRRNTPPAGSDVQLAGPAVVTVGAVSHRKGADLLVAAAAQLARSHGVHTYFAGNVDWEGPRRAAEESPVADHIHFLGFQPDPRRLLAQATIFVLPSRRDPAPLALIEAMEAGVPIVAAAVDGVPELLDHGDAGVLTVPDDVDTLVRAVRHMLDDEDERRRLADAARHRSASLSVDRVAAGYRDVYDELIRAASRPPGPPGIGRGRS
jgi:glycosyltransferase involved in cell wall biosynthesis